MNRDKSLTDNIFEFMQLCNYKGLFTEPSGINQDLIASQNAHEFLADLSNSEPTDKIFENIIGNVLPLTYEQLSTMSPLGRSGAHGQLFKSSMPIYSKFVWKRIMVNSAKPIYAFNSIREAFIQSALSVHDCAPLIVDIRVHTDKTGQYMYILMEKESHELFDQYVKEMQINDNIFDRQPLIFFQNSGYLLLQIIEKLKLLSTKLQFVHRDLKTDNIMLRPIEQNGNIVNYKIHLIDFGFSCITVNFDKRAYVIRASRVYGPNTPCDYRQDILSLFANLSEPPLGSRSIYHNMDKYGREVIDSIIPASFGYNSKIMQPRRTGHSFFKMMYNFDGSLLNAAKRTRRSNNASNNTSVWQHLEFDNVYNIIYDKFVESINALPGRDISEKAGYAIDNMIQIAKCAANVIYINEVRLTYPPVGPVAAAKSGASSSKSGQNNSQIYYDPVSQVFGSSENAITVNPGIALNKSNPKKILSGIPEEPEILGNELSQVFNNIPHLQQQQQQLQLHGIQSIPNINARLPLQATKRRRVNQSNNNVRNNNSLPVQAPKLARQNTAFSRGGRRTRRR